LQAVLGGKANPTADDVKAILGSGARHAVLTEEQQSPQSDPFPAHVGLSSLLI
jgi:hypothetical protein